VSTLGTSHRPLRIAIVGSGPSGFYAAEALFASRVSIKVDMFDRLPTPFGLVRYGVAPDHYKIKNVTKIYEKIASHPNFSFLGNVTVGRDITIAELQQFYDTIIFACGAETDKKLGIPGEDLPGSYTATEFVAWYNGHPDYRNRKFDLSHEVAVVVGQGNVAMDVSRILCKSVDELRETDIAGYALDALATSKIKQVHLIGRRGPVQAAFTPVEIKEFGKLKDCDPFVDKADLKINAQSHAELGDSDNMLRLRNWDILQEFAFLPPSKKPKRFVIQFLKSPVELIGKDRVEKVVFERNKLEGRADHQKAKGNGEKEELACGLFFRSVGYRGVPIPGISFSDERGIFQNHEGRIINGDKIAKGFYAVGWIKRGPSGVIGTNKPDSAMTVQNLLNDIPHLNPCAKPDSQAVQSLLQSRKVRVVSFTDWKKIDAAEIERGKALGKPREKFVSIEEMLAVLD